jgi:DNA-binding transcriptional regulator YhcF (GntR family)
LTEGKPQARLSPLMPSGGCQLRESPVGFRSDFHCTETRSGCSSCSGQMEIGLQDGSSRVFRPGEHFFSADVLPPAPLRPPGARPLEPPGRAEPAGDRCSCAAEPMMAIKNVHGHTLDHLGEAIVGGQYPPGSVDSARAHAVRELGVSRTVVREAVKSLVAKGMLVTGPKVGTRVLPSEQWNWFDPDVVAWQSKAGLTREFLRDLQELRRVVEPAAVRMAAERATAQDIADIEAAYAGMKDAIEQGGDYVRHDLPSTRACCVPATTAWWCR